MRLAYLRLLAIAWKECLQLSRDRLTLILLISVPIAQILLFGFAVNLNPKHWPAAWVIQSGSTSELISDEAVQTNSVATNVFSLPLKLDGESGSNEFLDRGLLQRMAHRLQNSEWLAVPSTPTTTTQAMQQLRRGEIRFVFFLPPNPSEYVMRGEAIPLRVAYDGSDPYVRAAARILSTGVPSAASLEDASDAHQLARPQDDGPFDSALDIGKQALEKQSKVDGENIAWNVFSPIALVHSGGAYLVPALTGVILTLTLTLMSAFSFVREKERSTWLTLMSMPVGANRVLFGKMLPYFLIGIVLFGTLQILNAYLFATPFAGWIQWFAMLGFILGQLELGAVLSLLARTQMQAMQLGIFFYLPSILLSGLMFPAHDMPRWATWISEGLPLTHLLRVLRADLFRAADAVTLWQLATPVFMFAALMVGIAMVGFRWQSR